MRPINATARDQFSKVLARRAAVSAADLAAELAVSVPTLHRLLAENAGQVVVTGRARRTRYALRRALRGQLADLPLYAIDAVGGARQLAQLAPMQPQGSCMRLEASDWPVPEEARDGWWDGLPYPINDMRPQGYLGRQLARAEHRLLQVPANPDHWDDDDVLWALSQIGSDTSGNLILGDAAFERWQQAKIQPSEPVMPGALGTAYGDLAALAVAAGVPGSSAAGEFPKFPALRALAGSDTPHVLVKFSGADASAAVQRWADLLVCEHLALQVAGTLPGVQAARSRIVLSQGRSFLEVERFDRHGLFGRSPLVSLATLDAALLGEGSADWPRLADRLASAGWLDADDVLRVQHLWWFGRLIANTDMHTGNLSFRPQGGGLALAPAYDMLPMRYAPLPGGELPGGGFEPALPLPPHLPVWRTACAAAVAFWTTASLDSRISAGFRHDCAANALTLQRLAERV